MAKGHILIVEDDRIVAEDIKRCLTKQGFSVSAIVSSGEAALKQMAENLPDLVLMDIMLEGQMNGTQAAEKIRSQYNIPVVYLTAYADEETLEKAKLTEPFGYIIKPFEDRELNSVIEIALYKQKMETKLKASREWFSTTLKSIGDAVIATDPHGQVVFMNPVAESLTGWHQEESRGKPLSEIFPIIHDETGEAAQNPVARVIKDGLVVGLANHTALIARDGTRIAIDDSGAPIISDKGDLTGVVLVFRDVRAQREARQLVQQSEERYRNLFNTVSDAIMIFDAETQKLIDANDAASALYGYSREEFLELKVTDISAEPEKSARAIKRILAGDISKILLRYHKKKNGTSFPVEITNGKMTLAGRTAVYGIMRDITERQTAEKELADKTRLNQTLLDALPCVALLVRQNTREIVASNETARKAGAVPGKTCFSTWAQREVPCPWCLAPKVWETKEAQHLEVGALDIIWDAHWYPIDEDLYLHYAFDITEKRNLEAQIQRSQKMESLGLMAGGVAHDLNNILSGIVSYPDLMLMDLPDDSPLRKPIETIKESGQKAADVVSDLLTIARGIASSKEVVGLNTLVEEYFDSAEHKNLQSTHPSIKFKTDLNPELLNINCSVIHIKKSLMNLVTNAAEASAGAGMVTISTRNRYVDEPLKGYENVHQGEYAVMSVSDDGSGISADDLQRIFEPFYTKKVMGRSGTGLGLAVVWNTMQDHSGYVDVRSDEKGTAFALYFPATRDEAVDEKITIYMKDYIGHGERVLVVDDEERQREIACSILTRLDYFADAVSSGEEAVAYLKAKSTDLVILDMIMPRGINGRETYERIIKIHPNMKAIIASGFAETGEVKKAQQLGAGKYIKKPYTLEKIGVAVKEELEK